MTAIEFNYNLQQVRESLLRFANQLTLNSENARDLMQDTFCKALINRDKFRENINFKAWVFTIMRNIFINNYRKEKKMKRIDKTIDQYGISQLLVSDDKPDSILSMKQVSKSITELDDEYRIPLVMHIEGYKYCEIAEKLQLKMGTVKSRIFLSRKKLNKLLAGEGVAN